MPTILLKNVSTIYQGESRPAIKNVNLIVEKGEFICIVGPNGAGKTTLLETICGCLKPAEGEVRVLGFNMVRDGVKARRRIGYVPQDFMVGPDEPYRALDVVLMGRFGRLGLLRKPGRSDVEKALEAMDRLGILELAERPIGKLSGGQQQKVMIARALAKEPEILLLDEPLSNLDYEARRQVAELLAEITVERQVSTLVVAHNPESLLQVCHRVLLVSEGRIIADVSRENLDELSIPAVFPGLKRNGL